MRMSDKSLNTERTHFQTVCSSEQVSLGIPAQTWGQVEKYLCLLSLQLKSTGPSDSETSPVVDNSLILATPPGEVGSMITSVGDEQEDEEYWAKD